MRKKRVRVIGSCEVGVKTVESQAGQISQAAHDGHGFFGALGDAVVTGATLTNVNDFRAILVAGD